MEQFEFDAPLSVALAASASYVILVYCLQGIMLVPVKLPRVSFVHDMILCVGSAVCFLAIARELWSLGALLGFEALWCDSGRVLPHRGPLAFWYYAFYLSKMYEFLDTALLILAKKRVIFLHVYHHCTTVFVVWLSVAGRVPVAWVSICSNLLVHVVMYWYYAMAAIGVRSAWKRYITVLQIAQFVVDVASVAAVAISNATHEAQCSGEAWGYSIPSAIIVSFLALFVEFYRSAYKTE